MAKGILYGIGVGPGDPELLTLKAARLLKECDAVAVPDKGRGEKTALNIVSQHVKGKELMFCPTPMIRDLKKLEECYAKIADDICELLEKRKTVCFITLGDPTVYSTYIYIHKKVLAKGFDAELVPGVPSFCAVAARLNIPLCERSERLLIVPASHDPTDCMDVKANKVFMKAGKGLGELCELLDSRGQLGQAAMVENCGMEGERVWPSIKDADISSGYFSVVILKEADTDQSAEA